MPIPEFIHLLDPSSPKPIYLQFYFNNPFLYKWSDTIILYKSIVQWEQQQKNQDSLHSKITLNLIFEF